MKAGLDGALEGVLQTVPSTKGLSVMLLQERVGRRQEGAEKSVEPGESQPFPIKTLKMMGSRQASPVIPGDSDCSPSATSWFYPAAK